MSELEINFDDAWPDIGDVARVYYLAGNRHLVLSIARNILTHGYPDRVSLALFYLGDHGAWLDPSDIRVPALAPLWADEVLCQTDAPILHWIKREQALEAARAIAAVWQPLKIEHVGP